MFDLKKSTVAISAAMVATIRSGDDANRFAQRATAEGFQTISQLIAHDALKQSLAIESVLNDYFSAHPEAQCATEIKLGEAIKVTETVKIGDMSHTTETLTDFTGKGPEVFANTAGVMGSTTNLAVLDAGNSAAVAGVEVKDSPLPPVAPSAEIQDDITLTSTTSATATNVDLDAEGLPWDARIHSSNHKKVQSSGKWQLKRNVDPSLVEQVSAELRAVLSAPSVSGAVAQGSVETQTVSETAQLNPAPASEALHPNENPFSVSTVNNLIAQGNGAQTAAASVPAVGASSSISTFAQLMPAITAAKLDMNTVNTVLQAYGVQSLATLPVRPDLIPVIAGALGLK